MAENYNDLPVSEETKSGMSINIDDQKWFKLLFDRQDTVLHEFITRTYDEHATIIIGVVRDLIREQNETIFARIDAQTKIIQKIQNLIVDIQNELRDHDTRIKKLDGKVQKLLLEHKGNHE
jgi:hypothetical protein